MQVCVPIDPDSAWDFDPEDVPTVHDLIREVKAGSTENESDKNSPKWERTSLAPSMYIFQQSFLQPLMKSCQKALAQKAQANSNKASLQW